MFFVKKKRKGQDIKLEGELLHTTFVSVSYPHSIYSIGVNNLRVPSTCIPASIYTCVIVESTRRWKSIIGVLSSIPLHWVQAFALSSAASRRPSQNDYLVPSFQLPLTICWVLAIDLDDIANAASLIPTIIWSPTSDITSHFSSFETNFWPISKQLDLRLRQLQATGSRSLSSQPSGLHWT
ncbi:hypothetical protein BDR04DRAFT_877027 [Suillus decipiens]|nr:hypothetical protein BDR04DRAFT_877027 [Suillus decipiens]